MAGTTTKVSVSNLVTLPTWMAVKGAKRAQVTVKKAASWLEPRFISSAVSRSQAGLEDLTYREGVLALGHAAAVTFDCLSDHFLQYLEERTTPALVAFAVHQERRIMSLEQEVVTGQTQAMLAFASVQEELQYLRQHRAQATISEDPPSLVIGENPLYSEAASLSTTASTSTQTQPVPDEASPLTVQPLNTLFTANELCDPLHNTSSPDFLDSAQPISSAHITLDAVTSPGPQGVPEEPTLMPQLSAPQDARAMMASEPHHSHPSVLAVDLATSVHFTSADAQMGQSGQTTQDDTSWAPPLRDSAESFGGFLPHAMSSIQSGSDRSDSHDSFTSNLTTHSSSSPRSTLPAMRRPVQKLPLLCNQSPLSHSSLAAPSSPVRDTSSQALQKSPSLSRTRSPLSAHTQALATANANSNPGKSFQSQPQQQQSSRTRAQKMPAAATRGASTSGAANSPAPGLTKRDKKSSTPAKSPVWK